MPEKTTTQGNNALSFSEQQAVRAHLLVVWHVMGQLDGVPDGMADAIDAHIQVLQDMAEIALGKFLSREQIESAHLRLEAIEEHIDEVDPNRTSKDGEEIRRQLRNVAAILPEGDK